ncbi:MAG TPA: succinate--CoA ligase subunit beta, partial [bacterium]|nr:succinate--CoA ligase subunit beta [bacterium]
MNLKEYQGKELYKKHGLPVAQSYLIRSHLDIPGAVQFARKHAGVVVKAQILSGKRGKAGGVKLTDSENAGKVIRKMFGITLLGHVVDEI